MKRLIFILIIFAATTAIAQTFPYQTKWKEIETAAEKGNVKSLLPMVNAIYKQAKKDNNKTEIVKALIFQSQILAQTKESADDNAYKIAIENFEKEISHFQNVTKSVLQSLLANMYNQYLQNTRWKRNNITELDTLPKDIAEWSNNQLLKKSFELYAMSVETDNYPSLQREKTSNWKQLLTSSEDIALFPTLFDVLTMRYINAMKNDYNGKWQTKIDSLTQNLIDFHKNDADKSAFLNFSLSKLGNDTDEILALAEQNKNEPFSAYIYYKAADLIKNTDKKRAYEICQSVLASYKNNKWTTNAKSLIEQLQTPAITAKIDNVCLPNEPIAVTLSATNTDKVFYRIYKNTQSLESYGSIKNTKGSIVKSGSWELKTFDDFSQHTTIVKLDGLPQGNYCIEFANNQNFNGQTKGTDNMKSEIYFDVHNVSVVRLNNGDFQVLDRKTGQPLANKKFDIIKKENYHSKEEKSQQTTNEKGIFNFNASNYYSFLINSESKSYIRLNNNNYENYAQDKGLKTDIFLDRAIYRPNQKVYFKAILYSKNNDKTKIVKDYSITLELLDANRQKISEIKLTTNEFGSVFGEFNLPQNALTGNFTIKAINGSKTFRVEEYKRPKFEVVMDSLKGEFVFEDEVKTSGKAESYAGAAISDAKVVYRVERAEIFPYRGWWLPPNLNPLNETIIQGETKTDESGKFEIAFIAKPKNAKKAGEFRTYTYQIVADVTDINGETRSATQNVTIGDLPKYLTLEMPTKALQKDFSKIVVKSKNLNGVTEHSQGQVVITQLIAPDRILLPNKISNISTRNYYSANLFPDYQIIPKNEFVKLFPHLPYSEDETRPEKWQKGDVLRFDFDTEKTNDVPVGANLRVRPDEKNTNESAHTGAPLQAGYYLVEAFTIFNTDTIKTAQIVEIQDDKTLKSTDNTFFAAHTDKQNYNVGDKIKITLVSDLQNATAILNLESGTKWVEQKTIPLTNGTAEYTIIATENHIRDGLFASAYLLAENGYKHQNFVISVKSKPMDLKISTKTFRNKILPGVQETWELTISGADKDKFTAEVLATMYDASLDAFAANNFNFNPLSFSTYGRLYNNISFSGYSSGGAHLLPNWKDLRFRQPIFTDLQNFTPYINLKRLTKTLQLSNYDDAMEMSEAEFKSPSDITKALAGEFAGVQVTTTTGQPGVASSIRLRGYSSVSAQAEEVYDMVEVADGGGVPDLYDKTPAEQPAVQIRKNLQETAFFFPNLYTDENGDVRLTFTSPEALTKWKLLVLAHTQDLRSGTAEFFTQTQKELMVVPNLPRFLREGDEVVISAKINNLTDNEQGIFGNAKLFLTDVINNKNIEIQNQKMMFWTNKGQNTEVNWRFSVPKGVQAIEYKIIAEAMPMQQSALIFPFSDGEQGILPVLPNRMLVTETMPIFAKEGQTRTFTFEKLVNNKSKSLENFNLTLEATTNPLWLAVMSLPYLREYPYECSEQIFSRLYGNILSTHILNQNPKIKNVFENWNKTGHNISQLEQNQELKNIILEETPWVRTAQNENEQRKRLAVLFDLNTMSQEFSATQQKLTQLQNSDGGFAWFSGGRSSTYITGHIVQGFGQLKNLLGSDQNFLSFKNLESLISRAIKYIDNEQVREIKHAEENAKKYGGKVDGKNFIHYYYVRSFWKDKYPLPAQAKKYLDDINKNISEYFQTYDLQRKAMIATTLYRYGYLLSAKTILNNLKETSVESDEMGMYWKDNRAGWYWYQSPVETQAKAIEAFAEVSHTLIYEGKHLNDIEEMKIWLIKNRQTNSWNSTKATTDAVYALMNFGKDWKNAEEGVNIWVGNEQIVRRGDLKSRKELNTPNADNAENSAGYIKTSWKNNEITADKGVVKVEKTSPGTMWGGMYWQYFEDLNKITQAETNVKMEKSLFIKKNTDNGVKLTPADTFNIGDLVTIRLVIRIDRDMEYIHIKDMRAAGFEPINVLSGYKYQNGCGYYESTRDAATNFFFERMTKGTYVFEYDVRANNAGTFSNGITTLQNMYAPEMSCHSSGISVVIEN